MTKEYRDGWERIFGNGIGEEEELGDTLLVSQLVKTKSFQKLPGFIQKHAIFSNIKKIKRIFPHIGLPNCLEPLKCNDPKFSSPDKKLYIGFSSSGTLGLWDIATMSMRGVCSCMHWDNTHSKHLIGSITDPFLGIVYISDNAKTTHGISFRRRALVRFVYDNKSKQFKLLIERTYIDSGNKDPEIYANKDPNNEKAILEIFRTFLVSKVGNKYPVTTHKEMSYHEWIPKSTNLNQMTHGQTSMSDCGLGYGDVNDPFVAQFANQD